MRITQKQKQAFVEALNQYPFTGELRLHGSRVDDSAHGGDIDLLLLVKETEDCLKLKKDKYKILVAIKNLIGDQKIDLLITTYEKAEENAFIQIILPKSEIIHSWP